MGLFIKTYNYSYFTLHILRQKALEYEGNSCRIHDFYHLEQPKTKFPEFILHSDCDGLYISKSSKQYNKIKEQTQRRYGTLICYFGDLDKLKQEVQELNPYMQNNLELDMLKVWNKFYNDVVNSRKFLYFR